jgi:DNA polymerase II large subunit
VPVAKLRQMGYAKDYKGEPLERDDQLLELKAQDVIPSFSCGQYLISASKVVDDLLVKFYGMDAFYNAKEPQDLVGELVIGLAPHTSAGILGRLIGYTDTQVCYAHPFYHTAKRRNADGDGDAIMLLMDGLINFSKSYLPSTRGGLMDAPLVLATNIDPHEIDKESHNVDVSFKYPLEFYEATLRHVVPKEVEGMMRTVGSLLGKPEQYEGFGFTHDTKDIAEGVKRTSYATLGSMQEKVDAQFGLGEKLRSVDISDLAARVIEKHFLPDMIGNLKKFSTQETRCTKCGAKYRRVPLIGTCKCGNKLILTVSEGSVKKYFNMAEHIANKYGVSNYMQQRLNLLRKSADTIFQKQAAPKKCTISDFL